MRRIAREVTVLGAGTVNDIAQTTAQLKERKLMGLEGKVALVTGGSRGIGSRYCIAFGFRWSRHCALRAQR